MSAIQSSWNGDQPDPVMTAISPVLEHRDCWCEWVDTGVGSQRVDENPDCPVHTEMGFALAVVESLSKAGLLRQDVPS
jgi:hypothetical protein